MDLTIEIDEILWNTDGTHLLDANGIAVRATEQTVITFATQGAYDNAVACRADAEARGVPK
jgi:hypothetical protein